MEKKRIESKGGGGGDEIRLMDRSPSLPGESKDSLQDDALSFLALVCFKEEYEAAKTCLDDPKLDLSRAVDDDHRSVLHYCVRNRTTRFAELLIGRERNLVRATDSNGHTALQLSVIAGNVAMAEYLLENGADIRHMDSNQHSVVHWAVASQYKDLATFKSFIQLFLKHSGDLSSRDGDDATPLHYAVVQSTDSDQDKDRMIAVLVAAETVDVNCRDVYDRTPLIWAATTGSEVGCRSLLKAGADVNAKDFDEITALHCAASWGHVKCIDILTKEGAEVDCTDVNGCTPIFYSVIHRQPECTKALIRRKANTNHRDKKGRSVTHCAAAIGDVECLEILKANKTNMWLQSNKKGHYPIHEAAIQNQTDAVKYLLEKCSKDREKDVNITNSNGRSCLHVAAMTGNFPLVDYLVRNGADINSYCIMAHDRKMTPLDSAIAKKQLQSADYLLRHGGKSRDDDDDDDDGAESGEKERRTGSKKKKKTSDIENNSDKESEENNDDLVTDDKQRDLVLQEDSGNTLRRKGGNEEKTDEKEEDEKTEAKRNAGHEKKKGKKTNLKNDEQKRPDEKDDEHSGKESHAEEEEEEEEEEDGGNKGREKKKEPCDNRHKSPRQTNKEAKKTQSKEIPKARKATAGDEKRNDDEAAAAAAAAAARKKKSRAEERANKTKTKPIDGDNERDKDKKQDRSREKDANDESVRRKNGDRGAEKEAMDRQKRRQTTHSPPTKKRLYKPYFSLIQEQVRVFEMKRLASLKMQKSMKFEHQGNERNVVRRLARDYNEEARPEDRVASSKFRRIKDFQKHLQEEFVEAEEWEKRLKQIEKVDPLYDSRPGHGRNVYYARSNGVTYRLQQQQEQSKRRDDDGSKEGRRTTNPKKATDQSIRGRPSRDDYSPDSQSSRSDDDYDSPDDNGANKDDRKKKY